MEDPCPLCGLGSARAIRSVAPLCAHRVVQCDGCGLVRIGPRPREPHAHQIGSLDEYRRAMAPFTAGFARAHAELLDDVARRAAPGARVLDIGAADGLLVDRARSRGFDAWGLEPARGAEQVPHVVRGGLEDADASSFAGARFDVVLCVQVLEHTLDPVGALRRIAELLVPGGLAWIETPNWDCLQRRLHHRSWWQTNVGPGHWQLFTRRTLRRAAAAAGLTELSSSTYTKGVAWQSPLRRAIVELLHVVEAPIDGGSCVGAWLRRDQRDGVV